MNPSDDFASWLRLLVIEHARVIAILGVMVTVVSALVFVGGLEGGEDAPTSEHMSIDVAGAEPTSVEGLPGTFSTGRTMLREGPGPEAVNATIRLHRNPSSAMGSVQFTGTLVVTNGRDGEPRWQYRESIFTAQSMREGSDAPATVSMPLNASHIRQRVTNVVERVPDLSGLPNVRIDIAATGSNEAKSRIHRGRISLSVTDTVVAITGTDVHTQPRETDTRTSPPTWSMAGLAVGLVGLGGLGLIKRRGGLSPRPATLTRLEERAVRWRYRDRIHAVADHPTDEPTTELERTGSLVTMARTNDRPILETSDGTLYTEVGGRWFKSTPPSLDTGS